LPCTLSESSSRSEDKFDLPRAFFASTNFSQQLCQVRRHQASMVDAGKAVRIKASAFCLANDKAKIRLPSTARPDSRVTDAKETLTGQLTSHLSAF
jgi:hypothetical protein